MNEKSTLKTGSAGGSARDDNVVLRMGDVEYKEHEGYSLPFVMDL